MEKTIQNIDPTKIEQINAMDFVIFPSLFEGFSFAMLEMQAASLRILCSDSIPKEINLTGAVNFLSLKESPVEWAQTAIDLQSKKNPNIDISAIADEGYDINIIAKNLENFYLSLT